ncbi:MAG: hypothetical protein AVO33_05325 [delta proteobacterium ML8_F1]|nr:MAG: hypothetical protein AVO33_05325 [delta proteobacterium ML8_F1]
MKKKLLSIIIVILLVAGLFWIYNYFFGPSVVQGEKTVTLEIANQKTGDDFSRVLTTEGETLYDLLLEQQNELAIVFEKYDFGFMVVGMLNYQATNENQEYFHLAVGGEDAMTGPQGIALADGETYSFSLRSFNDFSASASAGVEKTLTLEIINEKTKENFSEVLTTKSETLHDLLMEFKEQAGVVTEASGSDSEIIGLRGYVPEKTEYFHSFINGQEAVTGPKTTPLKDGGVYRFELRSFSEEVLAPSEGELKTITFEVVHDEAGLDFSEVFETNLQTLGDWLVKQEAQLEVVMEEYDFGTVVISFFSHEADAENQEYYHLTVDGVDATSGPDQIELTDGGIYRFELRKY